jgi:type I restriction enzyme S subunit
MEFLLENLNSLKLNLRYLNYYLLSNTGKQEIFKHIKATAQPSLSMGTIRDIDFIIPPLIEQNEIVNRVDYLMKSIYNLEKQINYQNKLSVQLTQSLLREAFEQSN